MKILLVATIAISLVGCGQKTREIETGGSDSLISVAEVDIQNIQGAVAELLHSMMATGVLKRAENYPARIIIGTVIADTGSYFDIDELTMRIRKVLVNSGQAAVITSYGDSAESAEARRYAKKAKDEATKDAFMKGEDRVTKVTTVDPDYVLDGKVTQLERRDGNKRQTTYTFRLTLTDLKTGLEVWTDFSNVTKLGAKNSIGF